MNKPNLFQAVHNLLLLNKWLFSPLKKKDISQPPFPVSSPHRPGFLHLEESSNGVCVGCSPWHGQSKVQGRGVPRHHQGQRNLILNLRSFCAKQGFCWSQYIRLVFGAQSSSTKILSCSSKHHGCFWRSGDLPLHAVMPVYAGVAGQSIAGLPAHWERLF